MPRLCHHGATGAFSYLIASGVTGRRLTRLAVIDEPVDHSDHEGTADDVADGDWQQVGDEEIPPGQVREICSSFADGLEELGIPEVFDEQTNRDKVHVGDTVLKAGGDKAGDGWDDRQDLVSCGAGAVAHPDGHANQSI